MMESKAKQLKRLFGGNWKYDGMYTWHSDTDGLYVSRVHTGGYDVSGEPMAGCGYFLYGSEKTKQVYFGKNPFFI